MKAPNPHRHPLKPQSQKSLRKVVTPLPKIVIAVPNQVMVTQAQNAARALGVDATILLESSHTVVEAVQRERENGAVVAIARGNHAHLLLHNTDIPLIEIVLSGQNMALLFSEAKKLCPEKARPRIGLVGFCNMFGEVDTLAQVLGIDVGTYFVSRSDELSSAMEQAVREGADVIIGGEITMHHAAEMGVRHLFLHSTQDSIATAIATAKRMLYAIEMEKHNAAEFASLVNYSFDAVLKLDAQGQVTFSNYMAEKIFRRTGDALHGLNIAQLIDLASPAHPINAAMRENRSAYAIAVNAGKQALIANLAAINVDSQNMGFILSLQEFKKIEELEEQIRKERYSKGYVATQTFDNICSASPVMNDVKETAMKYARYDLPVLLMGDVGVGKRALAECIHNASLRKRSPFVAVDCGGLSAQMQHDQFMGASDGRTKGAFEIAHTGTLLIEHVALLDEYCQYQLLNVLKHGCLAGLDGRMMLPVDVRVICTTGRDLYQRMREGRFLEPLYCMLTQLELTLPPLSERAEDLPGLLDMSIEKYSTLYRKYVHLTSDARELIYAQHWGGNVLQLQLFCEKLLLLADDKLITAEFVARHLPRSFAAAQPSAAPAPLVVHSAEEAQLIELLERHGGSRTLTAEALGISKTTLWRRMKKYGIAERYR